MSLILYSVKYAERNLVVPMRQEYRVWNLKNTTNSKLNFEATTPFIHMLLLFHDTNTLREKNVKQKRNGENIFINPKRKLLCTADQNQNLIETSISAWCDCQFSIIGYAFDTPLFGESFRIWLCLRKNYNISNRSFQRVIDREWGLWLFCKLW